MEVGRTLLSSSSPFPPRTHLRSFLPSSVFLLNEQASATSTSVPITSLASRCPSSALLQERRDDLNPLMCISKEDTTSQATLDRRQMEIDSSVHEGRMPDELNQLSRLPEHQLIHWSAFLRLFPPWQTGRIVSLSLNMNTEAATSNKLIDLESSNVIQLAKNALSASKEVASLSENSTDLDLVSTSPFNSSLEEVKIVKSTRRLERQFKIRRVVKMRNAFHDTYKPRSTDMRRTKIEGFDPNDPLQLFLWGPETKQLLTAEEESELINQVQGLMRLEEVESKLQFQFGRKPTLIEWAEAVGVSCLVLQSQLRSGKNSREKLINANLRLVVYIAKQYQGRGLALQDLLQEGSIGLMKSVEKFKPQAGCRFATYAYWWIRQTVRKAIFQHSRTIRLPENVYALLGKVMEAKRSSIQDGNHNPTKEEIAKRVGITVDKLEKLLFTTRMPLSMQQPVWADQDTTFQEITPDTGIEIPDGSISKQLMRQHVRGLLNILNPKERRIISLRFGIGDGKKRSLSEIGDSFGLCKERVRQLESRALYKLKQCVGSHGLDAYADLLV